MTRAIVAAAVVVVVSLCAPAGDTMPRCMFEDGSDSAGPCLWVDPDTGNVFVNPAPRYIVTTGHRGEVMP